jgi:hypothetical protein
MSSLSLKSLVRFLSFTVDLALSNTAIIFVSIELNTVDFYL